MEGSEWEAPTDRGRSRLLWLAVAVMVAAVVGSSLLPSQPSAPPPTALDVQVDAPAPDPGRLAGWPPPIDVEVIESRGPTVSRPAGAPEWALRTDLAPAVASGAWAALPEAPTAPRTGSTAVWTGSELLAWGGANWSAYSDRREFFADGAAYDPAAEAWRRIADGPLSQRRLASAVWTGDAMIIWGGVGAAAFHADGAAYDPAANRWRPLAASPLSPRAGGAAAWTGEEMIVVGGHDNGGPLGDGAAYDPATDSWRLIAPGPLGLGQSWAPGAVRAGELVAVWADSWRPGGTSGALYDPDSDSWRLLPEDGLGDGLVQQILWDGTKLLAVTIASPSNRVSVRSLAAGDAAWAQLPDIPSAHASEPVVLAADGTLFVLCGPGQQWVFTGHREGWRELPAAGTFSASDHTAAWTGTELLVLGESDLPGLDGVHGGRVFRFDAEED